MRKSLAIALFLPLLAAADPAFDHVTMRLFEQADGPILPVARRIYTTRFDAIRARLLAVEITAAYPAPESSSTIPLACTLRKPDGSVVPSERPMDFQFFGGETESHAVNLLWGAAEDRDWQPGAYEVECTAEGKSIARASFEMARNPPDVADGEIRVMAMRVFPVAGMLPPRGARTYVSALPSDETTRIGIELEFSHAPLGHTVKVPVDCWFFWPDGQTSPPLVLNYEPQPTWAGGYSAGAMGWEQPGNWIKGVYTVSCAINGHPVAVDRFDIG
jgi:hypothetical protein